ncbi:HIRAN domain-containing protein [Niallia hominis]|uniref:HIRAN domain-containing protein n=1 Tax=Niallia hominis TaxID=3133173 RepID=A0ABV1F4T3_9BACI
MSNVHTLLVVWQDTKSRLYYHVGTLSYYNNQYEFAYTNYGTGHRKLKDALDNGYMLHPAFPDANKIYQSKKLFPAFDRRLPSPDRFDFKAIMSDLHLNENSTKMDFLQQTRGRLANDTYSFEQPLRRENDGKFYSSFFVHGMRYQNLPEEWPTWLAVNEQVKLIQEPTNPHDTHAVGIFTQGGKHLGYVPGFYSKAIFSLLSYNATPEVRVIYINEKSTPHWWLKLNFECKVPSIQLSASSEVLSVMQ